MQNAFGDHDITWIAGLNIREEHWLSGDNITSILITLIICVAIVLVIHIISRNLESARIHIHRHDGDLASQE